MWQGGAQAPDLEDPAGGELSGIEADSDDEGEAADDPRFSPAGNSAIAAHKSVLAGAGAFSPQEGFALSGMPGVAAGPVDI